MRAGQTRVVLDPTLTEAEAAQARESMVVAAIDRARATALVEAANGGRGEFVVPEGTPAGVVGTQRNLVAARALRSADASTRDGGVTSPIGD